MYEVEGLYFNKLRNANSAHLNISSTEIFVPPFTAFSTSQTDFKGNEDDKG